MSEIIKNQIDAYRGNYLKYGNSPNGTFQNNTVTQYERFDQLLSPLLSYKSEDFSICDVGSGICDLHKFLLSKSINHDYTGVEIVQEMVEASRSIYPNLRILNDDVLADNFNHKFDFLVLSGVFNLPGQTDRLQWSEFVFLLIKKMYELCNIGIAFNSLTTYSTYTSSELFYLDPLVVIDYIKKNLSRHCEIRMSSPLFEDTYIVLRPNAVKKFYPAREFDKYFKGIS